MSYSSYRIKVRHTACHSVFNTIVSFKVSFVQLVIMSSNFLDGSKVLVASLEASSSPLRTYVQGPKEMIIKT
jgi:hypothetical protein